MANKIIWFETKIVQNGKKFEGNKNLYYHINNNTQKYYSLGSTIKAMRIDGYNKSICIYDG